MDIIIYNDYAYIYGGAGKVAFDSAIAFANRGYKVTFFSGTGPESDLLRENNITSVCLHQPDMLSDVNKLRAAFRSIWNNKAYKETLKVLKGFDTDNTIVIVHGYSKTLSSSIFAAFKKTNFKIILILHDYFAACPNGGFYIYPQQRSCDFAPLSLQCLMCNCDVRNYSQKLYRFFRQLIVRHNLRGNSQNLYAVNVSDLSGNMMRPYIKDWFSSYNTILNPVEIHMGDYVNIVDNTKYIFIGRLSQEKGITDFCRVISDLQLDGVVLGDGYLMEELKIKYPNIEFVGWADKRIKDEYIRKAKCLIFPSLVHETFGLAVVELLSYGVPCIMTDSCGASPLIKHGINGFLYPMGDYDSLKRSVEQFEKCNLKEFQTNTRSSIIRGDFSVETYINKLLSYVHN